MPTAGTKAPRSDSDFGIEKPADINASEAKGSMGSTETQLLIDIVDHMPIGADLTGNVNRADGYISKI